MNLLPYAFPAAPSWRVDWPALSHQFIWIQALEDCPQDPVFHAEGDVWIHVKMVCQALTGLKEWRSLPDQDREVLFAAALLHDVAKPACTKIENGRVTSRGHSQRGAIQARQILWKHDSVWQWREQVCALIRHHQTPFHLINRPDAVRMIRLISQSTRCDLLTLLAKADALGRRCNDQSDLLVRIGLFEELCREHQCWANPWKFASPLSRFEYFRQEERDPHYEAYDNPKCQVILTSGLPGAGKDSWIARHALGQQVISLDNIREEMNAEPTGNQGAVIQAAKERARTLLRQKIGFVWNATNLSRDVREQLIHLFTEYHARVKIVYVECPHEALLRQNQARERNVPMAAIERMLDRWDIPAIWEAPDVEWWVNAGDFQRI